ncbi:MAG: hypothetical protein MI923_19125 [Phycisphaerales bacterium]|nr:hypothetical protein [Phycisphaerales bacterium]
MEQKVVTNRSHARRFQRSLYLTPVSTVLFAILFVTGGMNATNCETTPTGPGDNPDDPGGPQIWRRTM